MYLGEKELSLQEFKDRYCVCQVPQYRVPLDFSFEVRFDPNKDEDVDQAVFYLVVVAQTDIQDAFLIKPQLRDFLTVIVKDKSEFEFMMEYLRNGKKFVMDYLEGCYNGCLREAREEGFA
jgi:hypothetical protein